MSKLQTSLIPSATIVAVVAFGITLLSSNLSLFSFLELKGLDLLFTLRGPLPPPDSIVIVAIDEPSMAEIGRQWPWPRSLHAQLIQQLNKAGAKVIGFDILFSEPSEPAEDAELARILRGSGNVVLVSALSVVNDPLFRHTTRIDPIPVFREAATVGSPLISIDADGVVRRAHLLAPDMPSFALQVIRRYLGKPTLATGTATGASRFNQKELLREALINYRGPPKTIKTVSYYQALHYERMLPPGVFAGKIVLVGRLLEAIPEPQRLSGDTFLTPFSWITGSPSAGVEIQANVIDNVLKGQFVSELGGQGQWILPLSLTLAASLLVAQLKPVTALITTGALAILTMTTAYMVFTHMDLWLPTLSTVMSLGLVYGGHLLTQTLRAEHERRQLLEEINRDLEARIAERTQELSTANQKLHQRHREIEAAYQELTRTQEQLVHSGKMASLGLLVAGVAHELNNPISYVSSNLEFVEDYAERLVRMIQTHDRVGQPTDSVHHNDELQEADKFDTTLRTLRELVASCREGTERVKKIVLDLRVFSRTDDVGLVLADLHEGIESTLNLLAKQYQDRITIHREYSYLPLVECYPGQINQVFMNLLQNAAQAIQKPKGEVWIRTELDQDCARIVIKDNGVGIPEKDMSRIFDPFFTTKPVGTGTGLGLSISYGIIEKHGGKMRVASQVGEGTEFTVELPVRLMRKAA
ncbi:MAG: CHASE2 domain-containing protein [Candidatus Contendobacter sp.]|nr:CHASE2 domain-containing protein [Candidatus Contendobacter sp.]MDS4060567.1 CHASE2 domain-containing protein [Candidatus Contendobacter sp.]